MKTMTNFLFKGQRFLFFLIALMITMIAWGQGDKHSYTDSWGEQGFDLKESRSNGVLVNHSLEEISFLTTNIKGEELIKVVTPGSFLPNNEGAPDLPGNGRYIAMPQGATPVLKIKAVRKQSYQNIELAPAPRIPLDSENEPLFYEKDQNIYSQDAYYPAKPVQLSEPTQIRGVDAVMLGITPFQYNPVTKELIVYTDIEVEVSFEGGNGHYGTDRLRSRWWDPLLNDMMLNHEMLPEVGYPDTRKSARATGCEYLIITPNDQIFQTWADSIRKFRTMQGILTDIVTLAEIGGNNAQMIETYINDAYETWDIPPAAVLLLGDYGSSANNSITSPVYDNYCVSDHLYADVTNNNQADIVFARITAQDQSQLENMVGKILSYERNPPMNPHYYLHPVTAMGWQTERWFQICSETINGFWEHGLNKEPIRENAIYQGSPGGAWSSNQNTYMIVDYFGPNGLGYIPETTAHLNDWGGNAARVNADINAGCFMLQHRDHGGTTGWGEPDYDISDLAGLVNTDLPHIFSINCLTGKFNISGECFAEAFHRHDHGCLSITAASETSYSFVNDTYVWGMYDNMWTDFMPDYGTTPESRDIRPAFGNAAGKYFLEQSDWPYNTSNKEVTYYLFHHHGGAFSWIYSEMPEEVVADHLPFLIPGETTFTVTAEEGALIAITVDGDIIGTGVGTGEAIDIAIDPQPAGTEGQIVITQQNRFRYQQTLQPAGPPFPPESPEPYNGEQFVEPFTPFEWENGYGSFANYYKIYLGTDNPPTNVLNGVETEDPLMTLSEHLDFNTTYYWRVDAFNQFGSSTGNVWEFTTIYPPDENFETGDFSSNMWTFGDDAAWSISDQEAFNGTYSAVSAPIEDGQACSMSMTLDVQVGFNTVISFYKMTSTDPGDKLEFYIDGVLKDSWGGLSFFAKEHFPITDGIHTLTWRYVKDEDGSFGDDKAWVDYIYFPPLNPPSANAGADTNVCEGYNIELQGMVTNCCCVEWTTSGSGTFDDNTKLKPVYTPSDEDILNGNVTLTLVNHAKDETVSDEMILTIDPTPLPYAGEDQAVCENAYIELLEASVENASSIAWTSSGDGSFNDSSLINPQYTPGMMDIENGSATLTMTAMGAESCGPVTDDILLTIDYMPENAATPEGSQYVDLVYYPSTDYSTAGAQYAESYIWELEPSEAGTIDGNAATATVNWDESFLGFATLKVKGLNECGEGPFSESIDIEVVNTVGLESSNGLEINVIPNPNNGMFKLEILNASEETLDIKIVNALGHLVYENPGLSVDGNYIQILDMGKQDDGIYFLQIKGNKHLITKKILIRN